MNCCHGGSFEVIQRFDGWWQSGMTAVPKTFCFSKNVCTKFEFVFENQITNNPHTKGVVSLEVGVITIIFLFVITPFNDLSTGLHYATLLTSPHHGLLDKCKQYLVLLGLQAWTFMLRWPVNELEFGEAKTHQRHPSAKKLLYWVVMSFVLCETWCLSLPYLCHVPPFQAWNPKTTLWFLVYHKGQLIILYLLICLTYCICTLARLSQYEDCFVTNQCSTVRLR